MVFNACIARLLSKTILKAAIQESDNEIDINKRIEESEGAASQSKTVFVLRLMIQKSDLGANVFFS